MTRILKIKFTALLIRHGLLNKATLHIFQEGLSFRCTLFGIVKKEEDPSPLTEEFRKSCEKLFWKTKKSWKRKYSLREFEFFVSEKPITPEGIKEEQSSWERYCQYFWAAYD